MREIKFRAWDYERKSMYKLVKFITHKDGINALDRWFSWEYVMQFTGLKDKNGKEIYEGDIVQCIEIQTKNPFKGIVEFNENGYWIFRKILPITGTKESISFYAVEDIEIMGNIYENPDLCPSGDLIADKSNRQNP